MNLQNQVDLTSFLNKTLNNCETPFTEYNNYCFLSFLDTRKKCDDLEGWCVKMDKTKDCCSETIQTKCPGLCDTCPGM